MHDSLAKANIRVFSGNERGSRRVTGIFNQYTLSGYFIERYVDEDYIEDNERIG